VEGSGVGEWSGGVGWVCPLPPTTDFDINGFQWLHQQIVHFHDLFRVFFAAPLSFFWQRVFNFGKKSCIGFRQIGGPNITLT
jgi:hypothetical protein